MNIALLAERKYHDFDVIYNALLSLNSDATLYLDINQRSVAEQMAEDIANILDIHVKYVPYATEIADRVLIIYTDGEYEIHESKELIAV